MFDSVLERNLPRRQVGRGASLTFAVHAALIVAVAYLSARPHRISEKGLDPVLKFSAAKPPPPPPLAGASGASPAKSKTERRQPPKNTIELSSKRNTAPEPQPAERDPEPPGEAGGDPAGKQGGRVGGDPIGSTDSQVPVGTPVPGTFGAVPFGEGMARPTPIHQPSPLYTREAIAARAEGTVVLKCVITVEGSLKDCVILKGVPFMNKSVLEALSQWRYKPVTFQGRPVSVYYPINLSLVAP